MPALSPSTQPLCELFAAQWGLLPTTITRLGGAGSHRQYYRLSCHAPEPHSAIGVMGVSGDENRAFLYLAAQFQQAGIPVPKVYGKSKDDLYYLQEDLGDTSLYDLLATARQQGGQYHAEEEKWLHQTLRWLPTIQLKGGATIATDHLLPPTQFDTRTVLFDLHYFKYCFLRTTTVTFDELQLENEFEQLAHDLTTPLADCPWGLLYRDFQARNVMWHNDHPYFIDFQGARTGPVQYDVVSFLYQCAAQYPPELRERLVQTYLAALQAITPIDASTFKASLVPFALFRLLQVLGAYGLRGKFEQKAHFLHSIPFALRELQRLLPHPQLANYPYLVQVLKDLVDTELTNATPPLPHFPLSQDHLVVTVYSFSYKKGIPIDESGNGGGYVFDCRAPHNPGRYPAYQQLTGRDQPVIDFLEKDGEIQPFLAAVHQLVDFHVQRYIDRGFTHLQIAFGCTGGQHRSVYCAEHVAHRLHQKFGIEVHLYHREQQWAERLLP